MMNTERTLIRFPKFKDDKPMRLMTINKVCEFLHITKPTLHKWTNKDHLVNSIKIGGRVYYKRDDIEDLIQYR